MKTKPLIKLTIKADVDDSHDCGDDDGDDNGEQLMFTIENKRIKEII